MTQGIPPPEKRIRTIAKPGTPLFHKRFRTLLRAGFNQDEAHQLAMRRIGTPKMLEGRKKRAAWIKTLLRAGLSRQDVVDAIDALYLETGLEIYHYFYPEEGEDFPLEYPGTKESGKMVKEQRKMFDEAELRPQFAEDITI